jgi:hypothetical protein
MAIMQRLYFGASLSSRRRIFPTGRFGRSARNSNGRATFRTITSANRPDPCISAGDLPAEVERSAETLTITVLPPLTGCEPFRYVIRNEGSGGVRLFRRNDEWLPDGFDHDLTPKK